MRKPYQPSVNEIKLSPVLQALSNPRRLEIIRSLNKNKEQNCTIYHELMPKSTLTHHLKVLREAGVIKLRIDGTQHFYSLRANDLESVFPALLNIILEVSPDKIE
jgi:DNA-binding transcriptional ArsR family regulator